MPTVEKPRRRLLKDFDWNTDFHPRYDRIPFGPTLDQILQTKIVDEGPRDGLQGIPNFPTVPQMKEYIGLANDLGIKIMTAGIATRKEAPPYKLTREILPFMRKEFPDIIPVIIVRPDDYDLGIIQEFAALNSLAQALIYKAAAPRRTHIQKWTPEGVIYDIARSTEKLSEVQIPTIATLEDATRTPPETIEKFVETAINSGATRICYADTVGYLDPGGTERFTKAIRSMMDSHEGGENIGLDAHFHNDRGFGLINMFTAATHAGPNARIHGTPFSVGARSGNGPLELFMYNLNRLAREAGHPEKLYEFKHLIPWADKYSELSGVAIPNHAPLIGDNIDKTPSGPHADAYREIDAELRTIDWDDPDDAEYGRELLEAKYTIYTGVNLDEIGRKP